MTEFEKLQKMILAAFGFDVKDAQEVVTIMYILVEKAAGRDVDIGDSLTIYYE